MESAHRGRMPADQASSSGSVAPDQRDVARACERACGVPCNLRVARQRATQQNAAMEGAFGIAQQEAAEWQHGMAIHASTVAAIAAGLTAGPAHEAATAQVKAEVAGAAEEARLTQEAIAYKEAEVKALEEALAQERAKKEAEERAHAEATTKAQTDAAKKDAIEAARRKFAEEWAKTEAELAALEAEKAQLLQAREAEVARAREEAEGRAAAATAAAMEEAEAKLRRETPPGGSRVETLRKLFEGDASSKMTLDEVDTGSSGGSGPTAYRWRKGKGKTPERSRRPAGGHPHDSDPYFTASDGDKRGRRHRRGVAGGGGGDVPMEPEGEDEDLPPPYRSSESPETETPRWGDMDKDDDMHFDYTKKSPSSDPPRRPGADPPGPHWRRTIWSPWRTPTKWTPWRRTTGRGRTPWTGRTRQRPSWRTPWGPQRPTRGRRPGCHPAVDCLPPQEGPVPRARGRHGQGRDDSHRQGRRARTEGAGHRQDRDGQERQGRHCHPEAAGHRRGRDQVAEQGHQRPAAEAPTRWKTVGASAATTHPWSLARRTTAGDLDQVRADPTPSAEPTGVATAAVPPLSAPPLTTARAAATSACRPAVAVRIGVMSGSARSTTTAVLHRGHRYAPDAPHQLRSQSQWLVDVMVDSGMRSPEETWSGMSAEVRTSTWTWRSSTFSRRVVYDGRPLNAAAGAVMRRHTWKEYGVNI